ncbi:alpha-mannosidase [Paenibacillus sp. S150]|uniref:alpha-mannosidase n=1 Tax=Paenibacillus sp. S150 TaxID=2749826 RepID=UPI001C584A2F|nr:alpha-mannosidase [Paenibacillus sp. S150]MBW4079885.1 alpha-mannosidase [Paenibacillus sp. S150]
MSDKTVHLISHSHWDREWYLPFEQHRLRLVQLFDDLIALFAVDPDFKSFHLDGQTILLEDYLQIRPEQREQVTRLIRENKLIIGPWYILQDEFLVSAEANVRNLLIGHADVAAFGGEVCKVGYFPDSFGNMGQAPQLLRQAGIEFAVFGRGVKPTGINNMVSDMTAFESPYSEMKWQAADGSEVTGILFANWYHNGMEVPAESGEARRYWDKRLAAAEKYASTPHLLFMNGCDHQPVQSNLSEALRLARRLYPQYAFEHTDFGAYLKAVKEALPADLSVVKGELRSQRTDGWGTLVNTASARVYMKQANQRSQTLLENVAEPLAVFAARLGRSYPGHLLGYAWKSLLQNHPHDSICGCSIDEVHQEMMMRYQKTDQVAEEIRKSSAREIVQHIHTSVFSAFASDPFPFAIFNTSASARTGMASAELEIAREPLLSAGRKELFERLESLTVDNGRLRDAAGACIDFQWEDLGVSFGYELPEDRFRAPYMSRRIRLSFLARNIPGSGYSTYAWYPGAGEGDSFEPAALEAAEEHVLENGCLHVKIEQNGTLTLTDKRNGRKYSGLCAYEDTGDIGSEYTFRQAGGDVPITTLSSSADIRLLKRTHEETVYEIVHELMLPEAADNALLEEQNRLVPIPERRSARSMDLLPVTIRTEIILEQEAAGLQVRTYFNNSCRDHRLRILFPTDTETPVHHADSIYEVTVRDNRPAPEWSNPNNCQHLQAFVNVSDEEGGLTVAGKGLNEYEVLQDGRNTIALTLLRAVGELGDWGVFPTPEAQCLGEHVFECMVIPHTDEESLLSSYQQARDFRIPWTLEQTDIHTGELPVTHSFLEWESKGLAMTAHKLSEDGETEILRWFNQTAKPRVLTLRQDNGALFSRSTILEEKGGAIPDSEGERRIEAGPYEIITISRKQIT